MSSGRWSRRRRTTHVDDRSLGALRRGVVVGPVGRPVAPLLPRLCLAYVVVAVESLSAVDGRRAAAAVDVEAHRVVEFDRVARRRRR